MVKACIFDLDGTLVDSVESLAFTANKALSEYGFAPHPIDNYKQYAGDGQYELIKRSLIAAGDKNLAAYEKVMARYIELFKENCVYQIKPYEGIQDMLIQLKKKGIKIAVLTNKHHDNAISVLADLFGEGFFDDILGENDTHKKKPSEEGAFIVAEHLKVKPVECLYVGDTSIDMKTGKNAGMFTIGVTWGFRSKEELISNGADQIIDKPEEIIPFIR